MRLNQKGSVSTVIVWVLVVLAIIGATCFGIAKNVNHHTVIFTVRKTERVNQGESSRYLVFTDKGTFENTDSWLNGKFNSSDLYSYIIEDQKYTCDAVGFRVPIFSMYENLIACARWGNE